MLPYYIDSFATTIFYKTSKISALLKATIAPAFFPNNCFPMGDCEEIAK